MSEEVPEEPKMVEPENVRGLTRKLDSNRGEAAPMPPRPTGLLNLPIPSQIRFILADETAVFDVPMQSTLMLGRKGPGQVSSQQVDVDLTPFNGETLGVSRYHAMIQVSRTRVTIQDFNSTNGTRLNGYKLEPMKEYRLRHNDTISLGQLALRVQFLDTQSQ